MGGGFGLPFVEEISPTAFVAGWANTCQKLYEQFLESKRVVEYLYRAISFLCQHCESPPAGNTYYLSLIHVASE